MALYLEAFSGTVCVGLPASTKVFGLLGGSGDGSVLWPVPELGPGVEGRVVSMQGGVLTPTGEIRVTAPSALVMLDSAI